MATPFQPTCKLRFVARERVVSREAFGGGTEKRTNYVLQQLWFNDAGSEWRDVPTEREADSASGGQT